MAQTPSVIKVDPATIEASGKELFSDLKVLGISEEKIEAIQRRIIQDIQDKVLIEISNAFTGQDEKRLQEAAATGLNSMQKITLVAELFKKKTGKRPEQLVEEFKDEAIIELSKQYVLTVLSGNAVTQISDANCTILDKLVDDENWIEALRVMNTALKKGSTVPTTPVRQEQPQPEPSVTVKSPAPNA